MTEDKGEQGARMTEEELEAFFRSFEIILSETPPANTRRHAIHTNHILYTLEPEFERLKKTLLLELERAREREAELTKQNEMLVAIHKCLRLANGSRCLVCGEEFVPKEGPEDHS